LNPYILAELSLCGYKYITNGFNKLNPYIPAELSLCSYKYIKNGFNKLNPYVTLFFDHFDALNRAYLGADAAALAMVVIKTGHLLRGYED
jgi:hypothetical protein